MRADVAGHTSDCDRTDAHAASQEHDGRPRHATREEEKEEGTWRETWKTGIALLAVAAMGGTIMASRTNCETIESVLSAATLALVGASFCTEDEHQAWTRLTNLPKSWKRLWVTEVPRANPSEWGHPVADFAVSTSLEEARDELEARLEDMSNTISAMAGKLTAAPFDCQHFDLTAGDEEGSFEHPAADCDMKLMQNGSEHMEIPEQHFNDPIADFDKKLMQSDSEHMEISEQPPSARLQQTCRACIKEIGESKLLSFANTTVADPAVMRARGTHVLSQSGPWGCDCDGEGGGDGGDRSSNSGGSGDSIKETGESKLPPADATADDPAAMIARGTYVLPLSGPLGSASDGEGGGGGGCRSYGGGGGVSIKETGESKLPPANVTADDPAVLIARGTFVRPPFGPLGSATDGKGGGGGGGSTSTSGGNDGGSLNGISCSTEYASFLPPD